MGKFEGPLKPIKYDSTKVRRDFRGDLNCSPIMPTGWSLSDSTGKFLQSLFFVFAGDTERPRPPHPLKIIMKPVGDNMQKKKNLAPKATR